MILSGTDEGFSRYLFEYRHGGSEYGIVISARSPAEAKERINALNFARYKGEVQATIHVPDVLGLGRRLTTLVRKLVDSVFRQ